MGDVSSDDLEARFAAEWIKMLRRVMEFLRLPRPTFRRSWASRRTAGGQRPDDYARS